MLRLSRVVLGLILVAAALAPAHAGPPIRQRQSLTLVMNYPYQITGDGRTKIHLCLFKPDFTPAAGAVVTVDGKVVGEADVNGTCIFDYTPGNGGGHTLQANLNGWQTTRSFQCNGRTTSFRSDQLYVYTDRGVYNPGDTIQARLIAWELLGEYKAVGHAPVTLLLQTTQGKILAGVKATTNEDGVAAVRLPIPPNMAEGNCELVVLYQKVREVARLRIERFVPPVIDIRHDLGRALTPSQSRLPVNVHLGYFAGGAIQASTLNISALGPNGKPVWSRQVTGSAADTYSFELGKSELDSIRSKLTLEQPFQIVLEAKDGLGRSSKVTRDMVYTQRPYRAVLELDKDDYPPGETVKLQAKVVDLDGKPARNLKLHCVFGNVSVDAVTDTNGVAVFSFKMGSQAGTAVVTSDLMPVPLESCAVNRNEAKPMVSKVVEPPHRQGIQTNFVVTFDARYVPVEKVVHVDFTDISGALVTSATIPITGGMGQYRAAGTVTSRTWGTMLVNLYCCAAERKVLTEGRALSVNNVGFVTEGQHVTLYPDSEASITVHGLKPRVKPGETVEFEVEVKTKSGQEAALGAALVDRSVLSLMDPFEVSPMDRFYNPQLKVISTGGAGVLTWPVIDRSWGSPCRDIAYTNWGFKAPGPLVLDQLSNEHDLGASTPPPPPPAEPSASGYAGPKDKDSKKAEMHEGGRRAASAQSVTPPALKPQIVIRTRFPETALWEPLLRTKGGKATLRVKIPDAITVQHLSLVASDRVGGVGLLQQDIDVRQDLFLRADAPAAGVLGDSLNIAATVENHSGKACRAVVTLGSADLHVEGTAAQTVSLQEGETRLVEWKAKAVRCGSCGFSVTAESPTFRDGETRRVFVLPSGPPVIHVEKGTLTGQAVFSTEVSVDSHDAWQTAFLNVSFPNVIPALQAWETLPVNSAGLSGLAGRALADTALLRWMRRAHAQDKRAPGLQDRLMQVAAILVQAQQKDGGWGSTYAPDSAYPRGGYQTNVYLSAYALRALTEIRQAGVMVPDKTLQAGIDFLLKSRGAQGLWTAEVYFWEKNSSETDWAVSAELFSDVVAASQVLGNKPNAELVALKGKMREFLSSHPQEPMAVAHAVRGLLRWSEWQHEPALRASIAGALDELIALKRHGYWEPHWYHAYGGMVEMNAEILELLQEVDAAKYEGVSREVVTWLLSTREAWGAWHNEAGTVAAVRALLAAGAGLDAEIPSHVTVKINGAVASRVAIDPKDPFLSAAGLRYFELTRFLKSGKNRVEVTYDGNLQAPVQLETRRWSGVQTSAK